MGEEEASDLERFLFGANCYGGFEVMSVHLNEQEYVAAECVDDGARFAVLGQPEELFVVADRAEVIV